MIQIDKLKSFIQNQMQGAEVQVSDMTGGGDHVEIRVVSTKFEGLSRLERHRLMHSIVQGSPEADDIHAVKFKTLTPGEGS